VWGCRAIFNCTEACLREIRITKAVGEVKKAMLYARAKSLPGRRIAAVVDIQRLDFSPVAALCGGRRAAHVLRGTECD
jgi:hypothetical protein